MRSSLLLVICAALLTACDAGDAAPASTVRRDVTYLVYATGPRFRYHLTASGLEPYPLVRDTAGSVAYTYAVPCGAPVALAVEALANVPSGAALTLQIAVAGGAVLARTSGRPMLRASGRLSC